MIDKLIIILMVLFTVTNIMMTDKTVLQQTYIDFYNWLKTKIK